MSRASWAVLRRIWAMIAWAAGIGASSVYVGLLLSYHYDLSAGATVVFVTVCAFFVVLVVQLTRQSVSRQRINRAACLSGCWSLRLCCSCADHVIPVGSLGVASPSDSDRGS